MGTWGGPPAGRKGPAEITCPHASLPRRVAVTAMGVVSPLGLGSEETARALRTGHDGVTPVTAFDVSKTRCKTAGLVDVAQLRGRLGLKNERRDRQRHPASLMMMAAARAVREGARRLAPERLCIGSRSARDGF